MPPLAFAAPLFLGGLLLIAVPWIIHRIRKPEREPLRFSSLMFVPKLKKEVIERRRIQHILLMLLRMLLLALVALAFARPILRKHIGPGAEGGARRHVILVDASFSMGAKGVFEKARDKALEILAGMKPGDRAAVIVFGSSPQVLARLADADDPEAGSTERARIAIEKLAPTEDSTSYIPAMQRAQEMLMDDLDEQEGAQVPLSMHLISDFQKGGLPKKNAGWRLSPRIEFDLVDVGSDGIENRSVTDLAVRRMTDGGLRIQAKVKNWSAPKDQPIEARLVVGDEVRQRSTVNADPGHATQVVMTLPPTGDGRTTETKSVAGHLEIDGDAIALDDRRYFAWSPSRMKQALIVAEARSDTPWPAAWFLSRGLPQGEGQSWNAITSTPEEVRQALQDKTGMFDLLILCDLKTLDGETARSVRDHVQAGGKALLMLGDSISTEEVNRNLLEGTGVSVLGAAYTEEREGRFDLLSWIDFSHPVFAPFQDPKFNDFSQIRFFNHLKVGAAVPAEQAGEKDSQKAGVRVFARFEADASGVERPAMLEVPLGSGRMIVWAFSPEPRWTTLPKSIKFVPLLSETLSFLAGDMHSNHLWQVGERYTNRPKPPEAGASLPVKLPGEEAIRLTADGVVSWKPPILGRSGILRIGEGKDEINEAVNLNAEESNPARITPEEFKLKVTAETVDGTSPGKSKEQEFEKGPDLGREFWRSMLAILFLFLLVECWYAPRVLR